MFYGTYIYMFHSLSNIYIYVLYMFYPFSNRWFSIFSIYTLLLDLLYRSNGWFIKGILAYLIYNRNVVYNVVYYPMCIILSYLISVYIHKIYVTIYIYNTYGHTYGYIDGVYMVRYIDLCSHCYGLYGEHIGNDRGM